MAEGSEQPQRYCTNCGAEVRSSVQFCTSCGVALGAEHSASDHLSESHFDEQSQTSGNESASPEVGRELSPQAVYGEYGRHRKFFWEAREGLLRLIDRLKAEDSSDSEGSLSDRDLYHPLLHAQRGFNKVEVYKETLASPLFHIETFEQQAHSMLVELRGIQSDVLVTLEDFYNRLETAEGYTEFKDEFARWYTTRLEPNTRVSVTHQLAPEPESLQKTQEQAGSAPKQPLPYKALFERLSESLRNALDTWREDFRVNFNRSQENATYKSAEENQAQGQDNYTQQDQGQQHNVPRSHFSNARVGSRPTTRLSPTEALTQATEYMVGRAGSQNFTVNNKSENSVTFSNYKSPSLLVAPAFLIPAIAYLFGVPPIIPDYMGSGVTVYNEDFSFVILLFLAVPMLIYFMVGGKHVYSTLTATPLSNGCRLVISGESTEGYEKLHEWMSTLPRPAQSETPAEKPRVQNAPETVTANDAYENAPSPSDIPEQIRKLAELRDAGILSNEEFETKKLQLLDRM